MKRIVVPIFFLSLTVWATSLRAQNTLILYVAPGETMYVSVADTLHTFGLGLTPDVRLDLSGITIERNPTLTNPLNPAINRAFTFNPSAPSFSGIYKFWYEGSELNSITETELQLFRYAPSWGVVTKASHDLVRRVMTSQSVVISPRELTLAPLASTLPVTWLGVAAERKDRDVQVTWKTADESDLDGYTVMQSLNGINWTDIGNASPKGAIENRYDHLHLQPPTGKNYYRIRARELTGELKYSKVVLVNVDDKSLLSIYPNPVQGGQKVMLRVSKPGVIHIWRADGRLVSTAFYPAGTHNLNIKGLTPGIYLISNGEHSVNWIIQ
jgi:hypothetical protein